jgi:predicted MFS family arabinose efflux permease
VTLEQPIDSPTTSTARGWASVTTVAFGAFVIVLSEFLPVGALPQIASDLDISVGLAGSLVLVPGLAAAVSAPLLWSLANHLDRKRLIAGLAALVAVSNAVAAVGPNLVTVLGGRALLGVAIGGFWTVVTPLGPRLVGARHGTRAISVMMAGVSAGTVVGLPAGQFLGDQIGWRWTFGSAAIAAGVVSLVQLYVLPRIKPGAQGRARDAYLLARSPATRTAMIIVAVAFVGQFAASTFVTPLLDDEAGLSSSLVTTIFLAYGAAGVVGSIVGGSFVGRRGAPATLIWAAAVIGAILVALPLVLSSTPAVGALVVAWGFVWAAIPVAGQVWMLETSPHLPEGAAALNVTNMQLAIAIGSAAGGALADTAGIRAVFVVAGVVSLAAAVGGGLLRRRTQLRAASSVRDRTPSLR